ncbi:MAG: DeoR/GlpR family DNA-binding transcription regulator [Spirochaetia bacterium]|nr:DeoR/GlpR family DNA-binding transcription regulator [Spirochaetia bacterium]
MAKKDFVEERHRKIIEYVNHKKRAEVNELALEFEVTEATIRRDLILLEQQGLIFRAHGGALRREQPSLWQTTTMQERMVIRQHEKERIAQFVSQLVHDGDSIMIDGGSTTMLVSKVLCEKKNMLIVTNSPQIGEVMVDAGDNKVILTGGELLKETHAMIGSFTENSLQQYRTDKAIIGVSGLLVDAGCFSAIPQEAEIKRIMSTNASETIVVTDSSKIDTRAFCLICDFTCVDKLVTDSGISNSALAQLKEQGVEVFIV